MLRFGRIFDTPIITMTTYTFFRSNAFLGCTVAQYCSESILEAKGCALQCIPVVYERICLGM